MYEASIGHTVNTGQAGGAVVSTEVGHQRTRSECDGGLLLSQGKEGRRVVTLGKTFATRLTDDQAAKLDRLARETRQSRSEVLRELVERAATRDLVAGLGRKEAVGERG